MRLDGVCPLDLTGSQAMDAATARMEKHIAALGEASDQKPNEILSSMADAIAELQAHGSSGSIKDLTKLGFTEKDFHLFGEHARAMVRERLASD